MHITVIVYCYNCSILPLVIVISYKLNFIRDMYVYEKNIVGIGFGTIQGFKHPLGFLDISCLDKGGLLYMLLS